MKFTDEGGLIVISVASGATGTLDIRVSDNGIGIAADAIERVFRPFERIQSGLAHKIEGTGLGLSIARGLMLLHGGNIILESSVGEGTTAIVTIPSNRVVTMQVATKSRLAGAPQTASSA